MFYSTYVYFPGAGRFRLCSGNDSGIPAFLALAAQSRSPGCGTGRSGHRLPATAPLEKMDRVIAVSDSLVIMKVCKSWPAVKGIVDRAPVLLTMP